MTDNSFFLDKGISNIKKKQPESNPLRVFRYIEENQPCSIYAVSRGLNLAYNSTWGIVRDLVFAGVVKEMTGLNESKAMSKILTIPEKQEVKKND
jgi:hypothetical protein